MTEKAPAISRELIEYLERVFADRCPDVDVPLREVRARAGVQRVVRHLRKLHETQTKTALKR